MLLSVQLERVIDSTVMMAENHSRCDELQAKLVPAGLHCVSASVALIVTWSIILIIIPLLRHFTIFGQENAQNMRR